MPALNRRTLCRHLPWLALLPSFAVEAQLAELKSDSNPKSCTEPLLTQCQAFPFEALPVRYSGTGAPTHQILEGQIPGGAILELHETSLEPGKMPHPAHRHAHAELLLIRSGTVEFLSDNPTVRVTAGGAAYCAPNQLHGFRNIGATEAVYFILKIGAEPICQK